MDKQTLNILYNEINKLVYDLENKLINDPCGKFRVLETFYAIIKRYVDDKTLNNFLRDKLKTDQFYKLISTRHAKFVIYTIYYSCIHKVNYFSVLYLLSLLYYIFYMNKNLKFCDKQLLDITISSLKGTHYFKKYGVVTGLKQLTNTVNNNFISKINDCEQIQIFINMLYALRTAVAQSTRSMIIKYYKLKKEPKTGIDTKQIEDITSNIFNQIMFYGYIPKIKGCDNLYDKFTKLPYLDQDLVRASIYEIIKTFNLQNLQNPTYQKIVRNINKLISTKDIFQKLSIPYTTINVLCYVRTILKIYLGD